MRTTNILVLLDRQMTRPLYIYMCTMYSSILVIVKATLIFTFGCHCFSKSARSIVIQPTGDKQLVMSVMGRT